MECPNCHHKNETESQFCTNCGTPLPPDVPIPQEDIGDSHSADIRIQSIEKRLDSIQAQYQQTTSMLQERLTQLEKSQGFAKADKRTTATMDTDSPQKASRFPYANAVQSLNWEQVLGGNWLARIGIIALIIGVAFFLRMAFDNNWISPSGRIVLGIIVGVAFLAAGEYWQRKYPAFSQAISGGGIAILYLSIFASHSIFGLVGLYPATSALLAISVMSAGLAIRKESPALAVIAVLGAFSAPFTLELFHEINTNDNGRLVDPDGRHVDLLLYLIVIDLGILFLAATKNWRWITILSLVLTLVSYLIWLNEVGDAAGVLLKQLSLSAIFLIFVGTTTLFHLIRREKPGASDQTLMISNGAAYFFISFNIMNDEFREWMGLFSVAIALFYAGLAHLSLRRSKENIELSFFALSTSIVFLAIAMPVQLGNSGWTTVAWATQGLVLTWGSFHIKIERLRFFAYTSFLLVVVRLIFFDTDLDISKFEVILNERMLVFLISIASVYMTSYLLWKRRTELTVRENRLMSVYPIFLISASFLTLWLLGNEIIFGFDKALLGELQDSHRYQNLLNAQNLSLTALLATYAALLLIIGITRKSRMVRIIALGLLGISIGKVFLYDIFTLEREFRIASLIGLGVMLVIGGYLYQRFGKAIRGYLIQN